LAVASWGGRTNVQSFHRNVLFCRARGGHVRCRGRGAAASEQAPQAASAGHAKQCAALWPRYLQADLKMGAEELDETRSPAEIEDLHRKYTAMCLSQGPNAPDIKWLLEHY